MEAMVLALGTVGTSDRGTVQYCTRTRTVPYSTVVRIPHLASASDTRKVEESAKIPMVRRDPCVSRCLIQGRNNTVMQYE